MEGSIGGRVTAAELVLPCPELEPTLAFFTDRLGFRLEAVFPAEAPAVAVIAGHGLRIRLERGGPGSPGVLRLHGPGFGGGRELVAPNGTVVQLVQADPPLELPPLSSSLVVTRLGDGASWGVGRAGMRYRNLLPDRLGGRFVASHIRIPDGGPVPDYVHYHGVRFQVIHCYRGWVRVVYEDQGPPFVLQAGDCVLQPPGIRHRVLESSPGLEVIEIGCPAEHETRVDHDLELPTPRLRPGREFGGQRFVRHEAAGARWGPWRLAGYECRDSGIAAATGGLAGVRVIRPSGTAEEASLSHDGELLFHFVLEGSLVLRPAGHPAESLGPGDVFAVPAGLAHALAEPSTDLELLEVSLPAAVALSFK